MDTAGEAQAAADAWERLDRRRARPGIVVAAIGAAATLACVLWLPHLALYLVALAVAGVGAAWAATALARSRRATAIALAAIVAVVAAAVVVPWRLAEAERTGHPDWAVEVSGNVGGVVPVGDSLIVHDQLALYALDPNTGEQRWVVRERVSWFQVTADGDLLTMISGGELALVSTEGEIAWRQRVEGSALEGYEVRSPIAARDGVVVFHDCGQPGACRLLAIARDGSTAWRAEGFEHSWYVRPVYEAALGNDRIRPLAEVVALGTEADGGATQIRAADTGEVVATVDVDGGVALGGDVAAVETGPGGQDGLCAMRGLSLDGAVDWEAEVPCLGDTGVVLGDLLYGVTDRDRPEGAVVESYALDLRTGTWVEVGGLSWFNVDADGITGVPGPDLVVQRDGQQLTGIDARTGDQRWQLDAPGEGIPGLTVGPGSVTALTYPGPSHNPFYASEDRERDGMTVLMVDAATGDAFDRLALEHIVRDVFAVGPGRVLVLDGDVLTMFSAS